MLNLASAMIYLERTRIDSSKGWQKAAAYAVSHMTYDRLRQVDVQAAQGKSVAEAIRATGGEADQRTIQWIVRPRNEAPCHRWRNEYGGLTGDQVTWLNI